MQVSLSVLFKSIFFALFSPFENQMLYSYSKIDSVENRIFFVLFQFSIVSQVTPCYGPYVSASSLESLHQNISLVEPFPIDCGGLSCSFYLSSTSALGSNGPLG